ncbi:MAG: hypothetical protein HYZ14_06210 [Bacteroidetes bacterium]|nr:hypothetical protein [Bacteroidota bacterium]
MNALRYIAAIFAFHAYSVYAQPISTFNGKQVSVDSTGNYTFIVSGHFYGDGTNKSGYPANTLLANIDWINESDACMLVCLGDLFMDIKNDLPKYRTSLFDKLQIPLFNAVGNHDLTGTIYQENFGATWFKFKLGNDIHVILDTEVGNGDIADEQLEMLKQVAEQCQNEKINNVFVYAHRTIWTESYPELEGLFADNTQSVTTTNFETDVLPVAKEISARSQLYWFAGSLGDAPASFFYFKDSSAQISYIATAIRAMLRDAVLIVHVNNGQAIFETHSFTGQQLKPLEQYNVEFWKSTSTAEPFNYRLIPLYIKNIFLTRYFWYGITFASVFLGLIRYIRKRRKRSV